MAPPPDPFLWEVEDVVHALCGNPSPWTGNPDSLASKLREEAIDGETLLTFADVCSRQELNECLGIRIARHKLSFAKKLVDLRSGSQQYRKWLAGFRKKVNLALEEDTQEISNGKVREQSGSPHVNGESGGLHDGALFDQAETHHSPSPKSPSPPQAIATGHSPRRGKSPKGSENNPVTTDESLNKDRQPPASTGIEPPSKRKRLQPVNLSEQPVHSAEPPWEDQPPWAYLGDGSLSEILVKAPRGKMSTRIRDYADGGFATLPSRLPPGRRIAVHRIMKRVLRNNSDKEARFRSGQEDALSETSNEEGDDILNLSDLPSQMDEETLREMEEERKEDEENERLQSHLDEERVKAILDNEVDLITTKWRETKLGPLERKAYRIWTAATRRGSRADESFTARTQARHFNNRIQAMVTEILGMKWQAVDEVRFQAQILEPSVKEKLHALWLADMLESRTQPTKPPPAPRKPKTPKPRSTDPELLTSSDDDDDDDNFDDFIIPDDEQEPLLQGVASERNPARRAPAREDSGGLSTEDAPLPETVFQDDNAYEDSAGEALPGDDGTGDPDGAEKDTPRDELPGDAMEGVEQVSANTPIKTERVQPSRPNIAAVAPARNTVGQDATRPIEIIDLTLVDSPDRPAPARPGPEDQTSANQPSTAPGNPPPLDTLETVDEIGGVDKNHWAAENDRWRLVVNMLYRLQFNRRACILETMKDNSPGDVWVNHVVPFISSPPTHAEQLENSDLEMLKCDICRIFLGFVKCKFQGQRRMISLSNRNAKKIRTSRQVWFTPFHAWICAIASMFPDERQIYRGIDDFSDPELEDDNGDEATSSLKPAKEIVRNKAALDLREHEKRRAAEQEERRKKLQATLALTGLVSQDKSRLIINDTKEEDQSLLYVNEAIGKSIKDHQVKGIRFLWNQIILDTEHRQGCLLAHTMGLGKTMQVITFLVAISEASHSPDPSLRSQIPEDLRRSQTIVLCPSGLVDNWIDELLKWAPRDSLGPLAHLDAVTAPEERVSILQKWAHDGGVLVLGYNMLIRLALDDEPKKLLLETPSIVVADEAHKLKNPDGKTNLLCSAFKTTRRIALTGSPLANNVEEYFSMIDWVAPNYLGPLPEFRDIYVRPIQAGLDRDSPAIDKRRALKMLAVLKKTVGPKVDRATIKSCLSRDLPPKSEFVITLPPTPVQRTLYQLYIGGINSAPPPQPGTDGGRVKQTKIFSIVNDLTLICNHPRCFHEKLVKVKRAPEEHPSFPQQIVPTALRETKRANNLDPLLSHKVLYLLAILDQSRAMGDKVLVFSQSLDTLNYLEELLKLRRRGVCRLDGTTQINQRQEKIRDFNTGDKEVYLISTTAGGVGLNIQGANRVVIFDSKWNPVNEQQAVGRAYRIGQTKKVFVYHFVTAGTFEEGMQSKSVFKTQLASRVVDKKNPISWGQRHAELNRPIRDVQPEDLSQFVGKDSILDNLIQNPAGGARITKIMSTDTFEEEDEAINMTAEEERETEAYVRSMELRRDNPQEYERQRAAAALGSALGSDRPPVVPAGPSYTMSASDTRIGGVQAGFVMPGHHQPPPPHWQPQPPRIGSPWDQNMTAWPTTHASPVAPSGLPRPSPMAIPTTDQASTAGTKSQVTPPAAPATPATPATTTPAQPPPGSQQQQQQQGHGTVTNATHSEKSSAPANGQPGPFSVQSPAPNSEPVHDRQ